MRSAVITGYLLKDGAEAFTTSGVKRLIVDAMVKGEEEDIAWRCEFHRPDLIIQCEKYLTAGRGFVFRVELDGRRVEDRGVLKGYQRFLRVVEAEFPARTMPQKEPEPASA